MLTPVAPAPASPLVQRIAFTCRDRAALAACRDGVTERGITPGTITDAPYGSGFVLRDPDGIELELFAPPGGQRSSPEDRRARL